ncbi:hypothetical protein SDJN03_28019, partial [Cucurbita argyrosperma subsp. sororia]
MGRMHSQIKLTHLGPVPIPICQTLSPFSTLSFASKYASSYHNAEEDWFPNLCRVINGASKSLSLSFSTFPIALITVPPDTGKQK